LLPSSVRPVLVPTLVAGEYELGREGSHVSWQSEISLVLALMVGPFVRLCPAESSVIQTSTYVESDHGFRFQLPSKWHVAPAEYEIMGSLIFASVNNQNPDFRLPRSPAEAHPPRTSIAWPTDWSGYIKPGMIQVVLAEASGLGDDVCCVENRRGTLETALSEIQDGSSDVMVGDVKLCIRPFRKWGRTWEVILWMRKPYSTQDRELAITMLKSIRFGWTRIASAEQAICNAVEQLPDQTMATQWPVTPTRRCKHETTVQTLPDGYVVHFVLYASNDSREMQNSWSYRVRPDGSVEAFPANRPNSVLQPTAPRDGHN
jgi:hypothetical protein